VHNPLIQSWAPKVQAVALCAGSTIVLGISDQHSNTSSWKFPGGTIQILGWVLTRGIGSSRPSENSHRHLIQHTSLTLHPMQERPFATD
jgi:hypothetical protein